MLWSVKNLHFCIETMSQRQLFETNSPKRLESSGNKVYEQKLDRLSSWFIIILFIFQLANAPDDVAAFNSLSLPVTMHKIIPTVNIPTKICEN